MKKADGTFKTKKTKCIDLNDEYSTSENSEAFAIGHSSAKSKTFLPHFHMDEENNLIYVDVAGMLDTSGIFVEMVNSFISK